jgi:hypothetical protein
VSGTPWSFPVRHVNWNTVAHTKVRTQTSATHFYKTSSSNKLSKRIPCYKTTASLLSLVTRKNKFMTSS